MNDNVDRMLISVHAVQSAYVREMYDSCHLNINACTDDKSQYFNARIILLLLLLSVTLFVTKHK